MPRLRWGWRRARARRRLLALGRGRAVLGVRWDGVPAMGLADGGRDAVGGDSLARVGQGVVPSPLWRGLLRRGRRRARRGFGPGRRKLAVGRSLDVHDGLGNRARLGTRSGSRRCGLLHRARTSRGRTWARGLQGAARGFTRRDRRGGSSFGGRRTGGRDGGLRGRRFMGLAGRLRCSRVIGREPAMVGPAMVGWDQVGRVGPRRQRGPADRGRIGGAGERVVAWRPGRRRRTGRHGAEHGCWRRPRRPSFGRRRARVCRGPARSARGRGGLQVMGLQAGLEQIRHGEVGLRRIARGQGVRHQVGGRGRGSLRGRLRRGVGARRVQRRWTDG
jgi:hypothetical protein